ncbi:ATP-binding protein [Streptomyces anulatus]
MANGLSRRSRPHDAASRPPQRQVPPLLERDSEVTRLRAALDACAEGRSTVVEIIGDPGLGKTRLLTEIASVARGSGLTVLSGRASEYEQERPFAVVVDALRGRPESPVGCGESALDEENQALLDLVFAHPARSMPDSSRILEVERFRVFGAIVRLLESVDAGGGVLLCLDDLHWADDGTLELLHYLLRNPPATPVVLACAYRPRQARPRLTACFPQTVDDYRTDHLRLAALGRQAGDVILGAGSSPEERDRLYAASGGNPLYLEVLARLTAGAGTGTDSAREESAARGDGRFVDLPASLRAALVRELALLDHHQFLVLQAAAVLGDPFDPDLLATVADMAPEPTLRAVDTQGVQPPDQILSVIEGLPLLPGVDQKVLIHGQRQLRPGFTHRPVHQDERPLTDLVLYLGGEPLRVHGDVCGVAPHYVGAHPVACWHQRDPFGRGLDLVNPHRSIQCRSRPPAGPMTAPPTGHADSAGASRTSGLLIGREHGQHLLTLRDGMANPARSSHPVKRPFWPGRPG